MRIVAEKFCRTSIMLIMNMAGRALKTLPSHKNKGHHLLSQVRLVTQTECHD